MNKSTFKQWTKFSALAFAAILAAPLAHAGPIVISADSNALEGNFQNPGNTAQVGYTIENVSDDGTNFYIQLDTTDPNALAFANVYIDTIASTPGTGSNLGFEFGPNSEDAFIPGVAGSTQLDGTGVTATFVQGGGEITADIVIPNSFFLEDPLNMGFSTTPEDTLASLHLCQCFGYSVVGGSGNYEAPAELGDAIISSAAPEPTSLAMFIGGGVGFVLLRRRYVA